MTSEPRRDRLIRGLKACGWTQVLKTRTKNFDVFQSPISAKLAYVGHGGAFRMGKDNTCTIAETLSLTNGVLHAAYVEIGHASAAYPNPEHARAALAIAVNSIRQQKHRESDGQ